MESAIAFATSISMPMTSPSLVVMFSGGIEPAVPSTSSPRSRIRVSTGPRSAAEASSPSPISVAAAAISATPHRRCTRPQIDRLLIVHPSTLAPAGSIPAVPVAAAAPLHAGPGP